MLSLTFSLIFVNRNGVLYHSAACCMTPNWYLQAYCSMGGVCSRKRDQQVDDDGIQIQVSGRYGSSKWLRNSFSRPVIDCQLGRGRCPSLMELCIHKICEVLALFSMFILGSCSFVDLYLMPNFIFLLPEQDIDRYENFSMLPRDISQQIFDKFVDSHHLTAASLEAFRNCAIQVIS